MAEDDTTSAATMAFKKVLIKWALNGEMGQYLGYLTGTGQAGLRYQPAQRPGWGDGSDRAWPVRIEVPRDRDGCKHACSR